MIVTGSRPSAAIFKLLWFYATYCIEGNSRTGFFRRKMFQQKQSVSLDCGETWNALKCFLNALKYFLSVLIYFLNASKYFLNLGNVSLSFKIQFLAKNALIKHLLSTRSPKKCPCMSWITFLLTDIFWDTL